MVFLPIVDGVKAFAAAPADLKRRMTERVAAGLIPGAPAHRNRYRVTSEAPNALTIESQDLWSSAFVGLNRIELTLEPDGNGTRARFRITFWRWVRYGLALGSIFLTTMLVLLIVLPHLPAWTTGHAVERFGLAFCRIWIAGFGLFFGLLWPFILSAMHRPRVKALFTKILSEA